MCYHKQQNILVTSKKRFRKTWIVPDHPYEDTVFDEYPGTWEKAFNTMIKIDYPFEERTLLNCKEIFNLKDENGKIEYDSNLESIVILPGLHGNANVPLVKAALSAFRLRNLHKRYNFFVVNMPEMYPVLWWSIFYEMRGTNPEYERVSELLSILLIQGIELAQWSPQDIHLVGMSVSGNLVGYLGRQIYLVYRSKVGSILSLDPVSNERNPSFIHVSYDDALVVHVYHTCSFVSGTRERLGTADFVINGAYKQPECRNTHKYNPFTYQPFKCSHNKVAQRFWYVILFPSRFKARKCATWHRFKNCFCEGSEEATMTYPIGKNQARGIYHIRTSESKPYGIGEEGSHCNLEKKELFDLMQNRYLHRALNYREGSDETTNNN